ncbi:tRNA threonylcarbamoyladenosine dehydratase [Marinicella sp. S1101]|uniref:tRNA threonylcarbamoyladenosine dehydratase n=1 Tax=Marinicella marina TaxID=2996016 RepID=UPI002260DA20|nr:tRNA threonylcarbamoyladenosine dehydratase [Marinicella marina]MCX7552807.1 tRNA threonylcarbamoyladenosine dehydratase [Marinicella marina]MDJ1139884.1 tRNA threonylcarbamoyladenosine dehydratase [Marinicella marina]
MKDRFGGIERLFGDTQFAQLQQSHVAIVGVGGVGCWAAEMLARSGVGQITLIDADELCVTNINRQIHALDSTVGKSKVQVMAKRINDINPECQVNCHEAFFMAGQADEMLIEYDFLIDAIDSIKHKVLLLAQCVQRNIPIITCGGAGGKTNPARIQTADLAKTSGDRLLKKVRYELRKHHGFKNKKKFNIQAVFSDQQMILPFCDVDEQQSFKLDCDSGYGTSPMVISSFGVRAADVVIKKLIS